MSATANRTDTTYTFGVITPEELDRLSEATSQGSFQQWSGQVRLAKIRGHEAECVGVCDASGNLVTGCVILYLNGRFGADGSVYFGPIGISDDPALLRAITEAIRESARRHHAVSVACWPNVAYRLYSSNGQPDGEPNDALLAGFADAGWTHGGFHTGYDVVCQWMYVKDLTGITNGKELLASFGKRAQWSVKRAQSMGVHVRESAPTSSTCSPISNGGPVNAVGSRRVARTISASSSRRMAQMRISCSRKSTSPNMWRI